MEITVQKLKELLKNYKDEYIIECGFEGLSFYKKSEDNKFYYIGQIDFGNERKRQQLILNENQ